MFEFNLFTWRKEYSNWRFGIFSFLLTFKVRLVLTILILSSIQQDQILIFDKISQFSFHLFGGDFHTQSSLKSNRCSVRCRKSSGSQYFCLSSHIECWGRLVCSISGKEELCMIGQTTELLRASPVHHPKQTLRIEMTRTFSDCTWWACQWR